MLTEAFAEFTQHLQGYFGKDVTLIPQLEGDALVMAILTPNYKTTEQIHQFTEIQEALVEKLTIRIDAIKALAGDESPFDDRKLGIKTIVLIERASKQSKTKIKIEQGIGSFINDIFDQHESEAEQLAKIGDPTVLMLNQKLDEIEFDTAFASAKISDTQSEIKGVEAVYKLKTPTLFDARIVRVARKIFFTTEYRDSAKNIIKNLLAVNYLIGFSEFAKDKSNLSVSAAKMLYVLDQSRPGDFSFNDFKTLIDPATLNWLQDLYQFWKNKQFTNGDKYQQEAMYIMNDCLNLLGKRRPITQTSLPFIEQILAQQKGSPRKELLILSKRE